MTNAQDLASRTRRLVTTLVALTLCAAFGGGTAAAAPRAPLTVLIGMSGVTWSDISDSTPNLRTATHWAAGSMAARSVGPFSCPADGWLAVSTGTRARAFETASGTCPPSATFAQAQAQARQDSYDAVPGLFGQTLHDARVTTTGIGTGARLALATRSGAPAGTWSPLATNLRAQVRTAAHRGGMLLVDLGNSPAVGLSTLDTRFGDVLTNLPQNARIVLASLADGSPDARLQVAAERGAGDGLLTSDSTRQPGLVTATDVAPTLLTLAGVAKPTAMVGTAMSATGTPAAPDRLGQLRDADRHSHEMHVVVPWFVTVAYLPGLLMLGGCWWRRRRGAPWPGWARPVATGYAMLPAATFLADLLPWWRSSVAFLAVTALVAAAALVLTAVATVSTRRLSADVRPWARLAWPAGVTFAVFTADLLTGSRLQVSSLFGLQPVEAGRFYGLGNPQFALFATSAVLLAGAGAAWRTGTRPTSPDDHWARPRRVTAAWVLTVAVVAVAVDATPGVGSDFGGPPALFPTLILLTVLVLGLRVTWRRVALVAVATVAFSVLVGLLDWLRPPGRRTHLGEFVQTVIDGGAGSVVGRKVGTNLHILFSSPATALVPVVVVAAAWYALRPVPAALAGAYAGAPALRHTLIAWFVLVTLGFLLNDAGPIVPPVAGILLLPSMLAFLPWPTTAEPSRIPTAPPGTGTSAPPA